MENVKEIRKRLMMTVGEMANLLGVSNMTIYRWESGEIEPNKLVKMYLRKLANEVNKDFEMSANMIRAIRKSNNMTQEEFAKILGVKSNAVQAWENNRNKPNAEAQKKIYDFYLKHRGD